MSELISEQRAKELVEKWSKVRDYCEPRTTEVEHEMLMSPIIIESHEYWSLCNTLSPILSASEIKRTSTEAVS